MEIKDNSIILKDECISYKKIIRWSDIAYADIRHAYIRVEEVNAKMCCGRANFDMISLILVLKDQEKPLRIPITKVEKGKEMLSVIHDKNPDAEIGKFKKTE